MTIAVTGATGQLGQLAIKALRARGPQAELLALVRDPARASALGVPARAFDYTKADALAAALQGVDVLVLISSSAIGQRVAQHANVIKAAKAAGVGRVVYTSVLHADTTPMQTIPAEHRATEADLKASGLEYTILRNGWYNENYLGALSAVLAHGVMQGAAGEGKIASASREDYAQAIAVAALDAGHAGKTYELAGDHSFTMADLAAELSRQSGKPVRYSNLSQADYAAALQGFGLPAAVADVLAESDFAASQGALFDASHSLSALIGRPTTPIEQSLSKALV